MASYSTMPSRFSASMVSSHPALQVDALELIEADHARIAMLFAEFDRQASHGNVDAKLSIAKQIFIELKVHMQVVEEIFHPAACNALEDSGAVCWILDRHAVVRGLIAQLESAPGADADFDTKVMILGEYAMRDVEVEETSLFPQVKAAGMDLKGVGAALNFRRAELMSVMRA
jgi:hypothetical protein